MDFKIRRAQITDTDGIFKLLRQVLEVHHRGRPDIFKSGGTKYTKDELISIISDDRTPVFAAVSDTGEVIGHGFCIIKQKIDHPILTDIKTLYIDDICIDESARGHGVGKAIFNYIKDYAEKIKCYNITLNVYLCNEGALEFYKKQGLSVQKQEMEFIL